MPSPYGVGLPPTEDHRAVRQRGESLRGTTRCIAARSQPFPVQPRVDFGAFGSAMPKASPKQPANPSPFAPAKEAGPVAGGERGHLVEEEQLGPAGLAARRALRPIGSRRAPLKSQTQMIQAFVAQRFFSSVFVSGIVDDAAVAGEQAARRTAWMSPNGSTRFCSGISVSSFLPATAA